MKSRESKQLLTASSLIVVILLNCCVDSIVANNSNEHVCSSIDIRNHVGNFNKLENCTVVEGFLRILLIDRGQPSDYANLTFPKLREVTDYFLMFRVTGLKSLRQLFPNLMVIRGSSLFHNFAFVIFEVIDIQEIGLPKLTNILRGGVRVEKNAKLCYLDTVDWDRITTDSAEFRFRGNSPENQCPDVCPTGQKIQCAHDRKKSKKDALLCWSQYDCQRVCDTTCGDRTCEFENLSKCCHPECLGGCNGTSQSHCFACKNVMFQGKCTKTCPENTYEYAQRRCLNHFECINLYEHKKIAFKPIDGKCVDSCPSDYYEDKNNASKCIACIGTCPKSCSGEQITSIADAQKLTSCTKIIGNLDIQITGGRNVVEELEKHLEMIKEITGYLKVVRSVPFKSLNFLKNLEIIGGTDYHSYMYSLYILDNPNLEELWHHNSSIKILSGKVFFHYNPKLCLEKIYKFVNASKARYSDEKDISAQSNGNRASCVVTTLNLSIISVSVEMVTLQWTNFQKRISDQRSVLGYLLSYREAPNQNLSIFDDHDACSTDSWKIIDVSAISDDDGDFIQEMLAGLKPYTQYAVYVKTYTVSTEKNGGQSNIVYFKTMASKPTSPIGLKVLAVSSSILLVNWKPPNNPNGQITHYIVKGTLKVDSQDFLDMRNFCHEPLTKVDSATAIDSTEPKDTLLPRNVSSTVVPSDGQCCPCSRPRKQLLKDQAERQYEIEFENFIHNTVYIKQKDSSNTAESSDTSSDSNKRLKREDSSNTAESSDTSSGSNKRLKREDSSNTAESSDTSSGSNKRLKRNVDEIDEDEFLMRIHRDIVDQEDMYHEDSHASNPQHLYNGDAEVIDEDDFELRIRRDIVNQEDMDHGDSKVITPQHLYKQLDNALPGVLSTPASNTEDITMNSLTNQNSSSNKTLNTSSVDNKEVPANYSFRKTVKSDAPLKLEVGDLKHFSEYLIEIIACHSDEVDSADKRCSGTAIASARTKHASVVDDIDNDSVNVHVQNKSNTVIIRWRIPPQPNGLILLFHVEIECVDKDTLTCPGQKCISHKEYMSSNGYMDSNLLPGNYSLRVRASSMAGPGNWTTVKYFNIPDLSNKLHTGLIVGIVVIVLVILLSAFGGVTFYYKKYLGSRVPDIMYASVNPEYLSNMYVPDEWEIPREKITILKELGQGSFGMVYEGKAKDIIPDVPFVRCAVKTVNESASLRERIEFLNEASVMKSFSCHHVVKLLGVVSKGQPTLVVMELMANGDLKSYLRSHRPDAERNDGRQPPTLKRMLEMAIEIADGMAYLAAQKFVHRDLAARNCMVSESLTVKIGDFGMTRDIYETDYYRKGGKGLLPVRWMAPESLKDGVFTSQSDVWSFGIVIWEMATLASQPYQGLSNEQVLKYVIDGGIMEKPENCPDRLYDLMRRCFHYNPKLRPNFVQLIEDLLSEANPNFVQVAFYFNGHNSERDSGGNPLNNQNADVDEAGEEEVLPSTPLRSPQEETTKEGNSGLNDDGGSSQKNKSSYMRHFRLPSKLQSKHYHQNRHHNRNPLVHSFPHPVVVPTATDGGQNKGNTTNSSDGSKASACSVNGSLLNGHIEVPLEY